MLTPWFTQRRQAVKKQAPATDLPDPTMVKKVKHMDSIDELFDELIKKCKKPEDLTGENRLLNQLSAKPVELPKQDPPRSG